MYRHSWGFFAAAGIFPVAILIDYRCCTGYSEYISLDPDVQSRSDTLRRQYPFVKRLDLINYG